MKAHSVSFKNELTNMGREIDAEITYNDITLKEELYSVTPYFEANLLKSVMKQLDIESSVAIPLETVINCRIGLKINGTYEMLDYGNYVIYSVEKQEDTNTYKIVAYDKMLYAMKEYEALNVQYPITIQNYLIALGNKIGLQVSNNMFYNSSLTIPMDLYEGLQYTYRDILDEIAEATGSIIVINSDDEIEVKYPTNTNDTINENYLKDVNVNFAEKYGPINSIVLSRAGESDNVYIQDTESIQENGLTEIKIIDNQIMNFNDRSDYLQGLLNALNGLYYYINDFNSIGIMYYDVGDIYNIEVGENTYQCIMLNDEIVVKSGIEEIIHTDMPEQGETDYTKADKTDRRINQTYLIVDKQNQTIDAVVSQTTDPENPNSMYNKVARLNVRVDKIEASIEDIADITTSAESSYASVSLENINESEPIELKVHPITTNITYLYPRNNLYPSNTLYLTNRIIRFIRTYEEGGETLTENIDYELPEDLLYYDSENYDEFYLNYDSQTCQVIKRCELNSNGVVESWTAMGYPPITTDYPYPQILLGDGDYEIKILGYETGYISARLMAKNIYTSQFYTKSETDSKISQTAQEIDISVNQKLSNYSTTTEMNSAISLSANNITSTVSQTYATKTELNTAKSEIKQTTDSIESTVSQKVGNNEVISKINQSSEAVTINANKISLAGKQINLTGDNTTITSNNFSVDTYGNLTATNANISGNITSSNANITGGNITLTGSNYDTILRVMKPNDTTQMMAISPYSFNCNSSRYGVGSIEAWFGDTEAEPEIALNNDITHEHTYIRPSGIRTPNVTQTSLEEEKKNFEKFENGLDIIKATDIYKYNLKSQKDKDKKHIGFVIGDKYNYSKEITSQNNDGVDTYSMISVAYKAIQEQQQIIESLEARIKELEEEK